MKKNILAFTLGLALTSTALAQFNFESKTGVGERKCEAFAQGVAEQKYLTVSEQGIQDHRWVNKVIDYQVDSDDGSVMVVVQIDGRNDDYDTWTSKYAILIDTDRGCQAVAVRSVK